MKLLEAVKAAFSVLAFNKARSALSMLGVITGVAAVTLLIALGQGAKTRIAREFDQLGANVLIIRPGKTEGSGGLILTSSSTARKLTYDDALALKRRIPLLKEVVPTIIGSTRIKYLNRSRNVRVQGVTPGNRNLLHLRVETGSFLTNPDVETRRQVVVLGAKVQRELFGDNACLGRMVTLQGVRYRVIGVIGPRGELFGFDLDDTVFVPVRTAQIFFDMTHLHEIRASVEDPATIDQAVVEIRSLLLKRQGNQEDFHVISQGAVLSTLASVVDVLTALLAGIAGISLLVGGIGIMNIMLVSVIERTPEIGLCKAVGARRRDILLQFLMESITLSVMGGIVGIIVGVGGAGLIPRFFSNTPTEVPIWSILIAFTSSAGVGIFFGTYPARKASLLDPIAALRNE